jgi:hypothetical protein
VREWHTVLSSNNEETLVKNILTAIYVFAVAVVFSSAANAQNCGSCQKDSDCGNGNSCCYMQYSNGSISCNYCKSGSCYTTSTKKLLNRVKELDALTFKHDELPKATEPKTGETSAQNCGSCQKDSDCGGGNSCCYTQHPDGSISCNYCKTGSCYTTSTKKLLNSAKELNTTNLKEDKLPSSGDKDVNPPKSAK